MWTFLKKQRPWCMAILFAVSGCGGCSGCTDRSAIFTAASGGDANEVRRLLDADPTAIEATLFERPADHLVKKDTGLKLVHLAARNGHLEVLKVLHNRGADLSAVNEKHYQSQTIHYAAQNRHANVVKWLIEQRVSAHAAAGSASYTPLHEAAAAADLESVETILARGASVDKRAFEARTPLLALCFSANGRDPAKPAHLIAKLLVEKGADVNARDTNRMTPLHHACGGVESNQKLIDVLLSHGADVNAKDNQGKTPELK